MARPSPRRAAIPACTQITRGEGRPAKPRRSRAKFRNPSLETFFALRASAVRPSPCSKTGQSVIGSHVRSVTRKRSFDGANSHGEILPPRKGATKCWKQCSGIGHDDDTTRHRRHTSSGGLQGNQKSSRPIPQRNRAGDSITSWCASPPSSVWGFSSPVSWSACVRFGTWP